MSVDATLPWTNCVTLFKAVGFDKVETFIASGNMLFVSPWQDAKAVEEKIEKHLRQSVGYEVKRSQGREIYWLCKRKQSDSKFVNSIFEKKVNRRVTFRGLTTIAKLSAKYGFVA